MVRIIHVNVNVIRHNKKHKNTLPACRVQEGNRTRYCMEVAIHGPSRMIYRPNEPLPCGAKLWIETEAELTLLHEMNYSEIKEVMENL